MLKQFFQMSMLTLLLLIFIQCSQYESNGINSSNSTTARTESCEPGNYSIQDGILRFVSSEDYTKSIKYLSCASDNEKEAWLNNIPIMTTWKYKNQWDLYLCDDENTISESEFNSSLYQIENKINISIDENGMRDYSYKYKSLNEFTNIDGLFKIGESLIKIYNNKFIQIMDGDASKLINAINMNTSDPQSGIFIHDIITEHSILMLCQSPCQNKDNKAVTDAEGEYRFKVIYELIDNTNILPQSQGGSCEVGLFKVNYLLNFHVDGAAQKHRWGRGWVCSHLSRSTHIYLGGLVVNHNYGGQNNTKQINFNVSSGNVCYKDFYETIYNQTTGCITRSQFESFQFCLETIHFDADATRRNLHLDFDCN